MSPNTHSVQQCPSTVYRLSNIQPFCLFGYISLKSVIIFIIHCRNHRKCLGEDDAHRGVIGHIHMYMPQFVRWRFILAKRVSPSYCSNSPYLERANFTIILQSSVCRFENYKFGQRVFKSYSYTAVKHGDRHTHNCLTRSLCVAEKARDCTILLWKITHCLLIVIFQIYRARKKVTPNEFPNFKGAIQNYAQ